jgi:hypothetical protein
MSPPPGTTVTPAKLPEAISGKIRRVQLRRLEEERASTGERGSAEFREKEFPELRARPVMRHPGGAE